MHKVVGSKYYVVKSKKSDRASPKQRLLVERKKKVLISNELFSFENIEIINDMIVDNLIFENKIEENMIDIIKNLNIEELNKILNNIDLSNISTVIVKDN